MRKLNKALSVILTICMIVGMLPLSAYAADSVSYLYYANEAAAIAGNTTTGSCTDYTVVSDQTAWGEAGQTKWYVVNSSVTIADRITVSGDVHLILSDGCTLTASKGIGVTNGNSLTIYGQSANESTMGAIDAQLGIQNVYNYLAAIGGGGSQNSSGQITVNGGKLTVTGGTNAAGIGGGKDESGTVTINGGFITATSQYNNATPGAAIGGGNNGSGIVTINGGHIVATGGQSAAGIGSGYAASATVTINGGSIEAHGGAGAAGIGSGKYWNDTSTTRQATVLIRGGTVVADTKSPTQSTDGSAAIGGGAHSQGFVTIDGGHVTATAPKNCTCIGNYEVNYRQTGSVTINGGVVMARLDSSVQASDTYYGIGGAGCGVTLGWTNASDSITAPAWGKQGNNISPRDNGVTFVDSKSFQYQDTHTLAEAATLRNGATLIPFTPTAQENVDQADVSGVRAWYPYTGNAIEPNPVVTYAGTPLTKGTDYTLSYTDDHTNLGERTVTITGQGSYTGTKTISYQIVEASTTYLDDAGSSHTCATFQCLDQSDTALGAGWYLVYDDLTINDRVSLTGDVNLILKDGKTLTAQKGISVPSSASLTIYAQSNSESTAGKLETGAPDVSYPGIGGPYQANTAVTPGNITVVGGVINATGGVGASAIGGATYSPGGNVTIKGGFVTATSSVGGGAAIGGGANADGGTITIGGGTVTATGNSGAAIGGGSNGKSGTINISGGTVTATANGSAAIGGGSNGAGETINITGGTVTATNSGETGGAGIGGGINAAGGSITIQNAIITKATANAGAAIGSGGGETTGTTTVIIGTGATIKNAISYNGAGIGSGKNSSAACSVTIEDGANVTSKSTIGAGIGGGAGASNFSVTIQGDVKAWAGGIGTQDKNGHLSAYGGAAIGGGANTNGGTVSISGGTVTARAIGGGAGIGSGANTSTSATTDSGSITISGGNVTATATHRAAGIGGGRRSNGGTITISGGTIVANGSDAAGIGHGGEDTLWEGQGSFYIPIVDDPTQDVGGAWYDSIVPIEGTNKATTDGTVTFTYTDTVSITASSYPAAVTLDKEFMYSDTGEKVNGSSITAEKTLVPYSNHDHSFTYSAEGATLTATCNASGCILVDHKATLTINAPSDLTYDGTAKAATVVGTIPGVATPEIVYKQGNTVLGAVPVSAGSYTASITLDDKTASASYTIAQKNVTVTAKAQTVAVDGSIASGSTQATLTGAVAGHTLTAVTLTASSTASVGSGTITPSAATIKDANGNDVTGNYNITYKTGTLTVTAPTTYAVTVTNGTGGGNYAPGATVTITANAPATGKVFDKWTTNDGVTFASATSATTTFTMPAKAVAVSATYKNASYKVTLNKNGGTISSGNVTSYTYGTETTLPTGVTKAGYRLDGWYANDKFTGSAVTKIGANETGDKTFYAKWTLVPSLANGKVTAPKGAVLICAEYEASGRMKSMRSVTLTADCVNADAATLLGVTLPGSYKLMLVDGTTYAPLCAAWEKKA